VKNFGGAKHMKRNFKVLFLLLTLSVCALGQTTDLQTILKTAVAHAKEASLYQDTVDWKTLEPQVYAKAKNAKKVEDLIPAFNYLLGELGDFHGKIIYKNRPVAFGRRKTPIKRPDIKGDIWTLMQSAKISFEAKLLKNQIGYIKIPAMPMGDNVKMSKEIRDAVCNLKSQKAEQWILDLRYNGGGNMYPMFEGIAEILGEGIVATTQNSRGEKLSTWKIEDSNFFYDEYRAVELPNKCFDGKPPKVAVLLSPYTASSGEAVATAFKNRPNTKFFGAKTAGYTTVTDWTKLDEDLFMTISSSYYADRTGIAFKKYIEVDVPTEFFMPEEFAKDSAIEKASGWLLQRSDSGVSLENDKAELMRLHKEHQTAHLTYDAELFLESFADEVTQLQRGQVKTQDKAANLKRFKSYFSSYKFIEWEDIKPPVIKISKDGTLATIIVEKRVRGTYKNDKGEEEKDLTIFAWLEVWEKIDGKWKITTIASTARYGASDKK